MHAIYFAADPPNILTEIEMCAEVPPHNISVSLSRQARSLANLLLNCLVQVNRINLGVVVGHHLSIAVDNELSEVPGDFSGLLGLCVVELRVSSEILVDIARVGSIHLDLREEGELGK